MDKNIAGQETLVQAVKERENSRPIGKLKMDKKIGGRISDVKTKRNPTQKQRKIINTQRIKEIEIQHSI